MTTQIAIRLDDQVVDELDRVVQRGDGPTNRTEVIRAALDLYLGLQERREIDAALVRGYREHAPGTPDDWGALDDQTEANSTQALAQLDAEDGGW